MCPIYQVNVSRKRVLCAPESGNFFETPCVVEIMYLRMSATGKSYTQNFFKVQYIIIEAILSRKSMKKITVTDEKIFGVYKAFERER